MPTLPLACSRTHTSQTLSGEQLLLAAVLRQAVADAKSQSQVRAGVWAREDAQCWLRARDNIVVVCELLNLDVEYMYPRLLAEAGMEDHP